MLQVIGHAEIGDTLLDLERLSVKLSAPMMGVWLSTTVEPFLKARTRNRFAEESWDNGEWKALAPATVEERTMLGFPPSHPIQRRTGELEDYFSENNGDYFISSVGVMLKYPGGQPEGEKLAYKIRQAQYGVARTGAPRRPVLNLSIIDYEYIMMGLFRYVII